MDLFDLVREDETARQAPLAARMRPQTLGEVVGQEHILGPGKMLTRMIQADRLHSVIFYGPPGTGKTSLARVIANSTSACFEKINATTAGKKEMEAAVQKAKDVLGMQGKKTILFIDEIHRFNKGQQDFLLPFVENGTIVLIGATTENPYFEVNGALLSRSTVFELRPLSVENIKTVLQRALADEKRGLASLHVSLTKDAEDFLAQACGGDARSALNALELGALTTPVGKDGRILIDLAAASQCIQKRVVTYDKSGDGHYDTISAFIKSMRGSDPDAAVYYLAKMLYAGEDPKFIARRIIICASEDVGNADPRALLVAIAACEAVERVGLPEGQLNLAQAAIYVASAPKSNACTLAIQEAMESVKRDPSPAVPDHLKDAHYGGAAKLGHGLGYQYAHDYPHHYVKQQYLPSQIEGTVFYRPSQGGEEKHIAAFLQSLKHGEEDE